MLKNLLLLALSTLFALVLAEVGTRTNVVPVPGYVNVTGWWKEIWFRTRRSLIPKEFVKLDPELGWRVAPGLVDRPLNDAVVSTNSRGMRGPREVPRERDGRFRIVAVGDSFTFGQCVGDDQTFPAQLERMLPGTEVLNLGVPGYGHGQMLLRLRRDGLPYHPDVVVLGFHHTDISRNPLYFRDYGKPRFRVEDDHLVLHNVPVPTPEEYARALWPPRLANYASMLYGHLFWDEVQGEGYQLARWIVRQMSRDVAAAGARFVLVYLPRQKDLRAGRPYPIHTVRRACEEDEVICASPIARIRDALEGEDVAEHFDCHYSPRVYALVAEETAQTLRRAFPDRLGPGVRASGRPGPAHADPPTSGERAGP